ncbi:EF-hand domain-containing protein [Humidesulfovibrio sp.]
MDEMDSKLSASIIAEKDTDASGDVSAAEMGVSTSELAEFDSNGDGVLSSAELAAALKSKREKMQAQMSTQMEQSSQLGMLQSTLNGSSTQASGSAEEPSLDKLIAGLFSDGAGAAVSAGAQAQSGSNAGSSLSDYLEQMDAQMAETIMSIKDSYGDGQLSAEEMGATAEQLAKLDTDGDGVLSEAELTDGLRAERETMMAENGGVIPPPSGDSSTTAGSSGTGKVGSEMDSASMDALMQSMFSSSLGSSTSSATDSTSVSASVLSEYLLRQKASSAYQNIDNLIAGLFGGGASTQSVSLEA